MSDKYPTTIAEAVEIMIERGDSDLDTVFRERWIGSRVAQGWTREAAIEELNEEGKKAKASIEAKKAMLGE